VTTDVALAIESNVRGVRSRMAAACARSGRDPARVRLIAVSKTVPAAGVAAAVAAGIEAVGENYVQEAAGKRSELGAMGLSVEWHLIGHLQSNKVAAALGAFDVLESVDSVRLAEAISRRASELVPVLLEVNVAGEPSKTGFAPEEVAEVVRLASRLPNIDLRGLMTVAPAASAPEEVRPCFRTLARLAAANGLAELSMGMTGDFEVAIEEGSTMVRIGRAIFGERVR
jgi:PLP dependent protein